jgi:hypothetical protein
MRDAGIDVVRDHVSLQVVVLRHSLLARTLQVFDRLRRKDLARIEVPAVDRRIRRACACRLLQTVMRSDYVQQEQIAARFFSLLAIRDPYEVVIETRQATLRVRDRRKWFQLAGRLRPNQKRLLPDGEVAFSGRNEVEGDFIVDGALLPIPQHLRFAGDALRLMRLSRELARRPVRFTIRRGEIVDVSGDGRLPRVLWQLFQSNERYRQINEVGIAFNSASTRFIHSWPAASNEVRPGVHLGLGGGPNPNARTSLVHLDCIAANCQVFVNGHPFLRATGARTAAPRAPRAAGRG